jgi:hypothetical protein
VNGGNGRQHEERVATLRALRLELERLRRDGPSAGRCEGLLAAIDRQYAAWTTRSADVLAAPTAPRTGVAVERGREAAGELRKLAVLRSLVLALCRR